MDNLLKIVALVILSAVFALIILFGFGAFEMPWFEEVYSRAG